jgi:hypothetical protein
MTTKRSTQARPGSLYGDAFTSIHRFANELRDFVANRFDTALEKPIGMGERRTLAHYAGKLREILGSTGLREVEHGQEVARALRPVNNILLRYAGPAGDRAEVLKKLRQINRITERLVKKYKMHQLPPHRGKSVARKGGVTFEHRAKTLSQTARGILTRKRIPPHFLITLHGRVQQADRLLHQDDNAEKYKGTPFRTIGTALGNAEDALLRAMAANDKGKDARLRHYLGKFFDATQEIMRVVNQVGASSKASAAAKGAGVGAAIRSLTTAKKVVAREYRRVGQMGRGNTASIVGARRHIKMAWIAADGDPNYQQLTGAPREVIKRGFSISLKHLHVAETKANFRPGNEEAEKEYLGILRTALVFLSRLQANLKALS